jgi:hypothetical protein
MGVKTALAGITFTTQGKNGAAALGLDMADYVLGMQLTCQELTAKMNFLITDVLTPAGSEGSNITTVNAQITALS